MKKYFSIFLFTYALLFNPLFVYNQDYIDEKEYLEKINKIKASKIKSESILIMESKNSNTYSAIKLIEYDKEGYVKSITDITNIRNIEYEYDDSKKLISITKYTSTGEFLKYDIPLYKYEFVYNEFDDVMTVNVFNTDDNHSFVYWTTKKNIYDINSNIIGELYIDKYNDTIARNEYIYDRNNNLIVFEGFTSTDLIRRCEFVYDIHNNLIVELTHNIENNKYLKSDHFYNLHGDRILTKKYGENNSYIEKINYEYDLNGNKLYENVYNLKENYTFIIKHYYTYHGIE